MDEKDGKGQRQLGLVICGRDFVFAAWRVDAQALPCYWV
jgi:hypothetical protein